MVYLLASQAFFTGFLHPYCLGWVLGISHFHGARHYQPTASHYGWLVNLLSFNAGLHVEHHDLMTIPWRRLPKLRQIAPEFYDNLETIPSYTWLALQVRLCRPGHSSKPISTTRPTATRRGSRREPDAAPAGETACQDGCPATLRPPTRFCRKTCP